MASSTEDTREIMGAVYDTISACVEGIDVNSLTTFDLEYIFIQLRAKSTGETSEISVRCPSCREPNRKIVPLNEIVCTKSNADPIIHISEEVTVEMKYPSYKDVPTGMDDAEMGLGLLAASIKSVIYNGERINAEDEPPEQIVEFLESMTQEQFQKITKFFDDAPVVKYDMPLTCKECGEETTIVIRGMNSFF